MAGSSQHTADDFFHSVLSKLRETAHQQSLAYDYNFEEDHPQTYTGHYQWEKDIERSSFPLMPRFSVSTAATLTQDLPQLPLPELLIPAHWTLPDMEIAGEGETQPPRSLDDGLRTRRRAVTDPE